MVGLALLESWFPILSIVAISHIGVLPIVAFFAWIIEPEISYVNIYEALPYVVLIGLLIFGVSKIMCTE